MAGTDRAGVLEGEKTFVINLDFPSSEVWPQ